MILRIGTRGSRLAITQSEWVKGRIESGHPDVSVELVRIKTKGDKVLDSPLSKIGGKGLFVKEIEEALLRKEVDLAVHSIKDVPAELPEGLHLPVFPEREDPRDAFISTDYESVGELPDGASVGTGSLRRSSQLLHMRPDLDIVPLRGNVDTRIKRLESGNLHAIILAAAGLRRLGLSAKISQLLPAEEFLPAIGQGALGLELRQDNDRVYDILRSLNHEATEMTVRAERAFLKELEGGCQVPIAAHCRLEGEVVILHGMVAELDGSRIIKDELRGQKERPEETGINLARRLLSSGADEILKRIYGKG
ncbi:MAG: hydroxymethylbilane synthase [Deltaproteobacteria bacterium]|nr:hydroxymethylbilane synthase [Deltaproteobacteria bacterium]